MRNMRKKGLLCILAATLILTCCAAEVYAESSLRGSNFSDSDGDGVCDLREEPAASYNGKTRYGCGLASGRGFADSDGDGICDNCTNGAFCGRGTPRSGRNCKIR